MDQTMENTSSQMKTTPAPKTLDRTQFIQLLSAGLSSTHTRFTKETAISWLGDYPGDLVVSLYYAIALMNDGHSKLALPILEGLAQSDPEFSENIEVLVRLRRKHRGLSSDPTSGNSDLGRDIAAGTLPGQELVTWLYGLRGPRMFTKENSFGYRYDDISQWGQPLWQARRSIRKGDIEQTENKQNRLEQTIITFVFLHIHGLFEWQ